MYLKPIQASDKFFLPDPTNYFGTAARRSASGSSSSKSESDKEPKANKAMWQHNFLLDQEKRMIDIAQTQLENQALDLLVNTYNGDVNAFQRGEFDKMQNGEGFYANLSRVQNANSIYRSNKLSAEMELQKWEGLAEKARTDEALNMVIEDDFNNPMRRGNDGKIYQLGKNENGALVYMADDGTVKPKEEGDKFDYLTMQDYLQSVYFQSGYQDGVAVGPRNYKETFDMKQQTFMTEIKDILSAAASTKNESGGKQEYLVGKDQVPMDANAAKSVADNWTFLKTVEQTGYSNVKNLLTAVNSIYSSLSPNAKRDLRQRLYQAQRSGVQMQSAPNIKGESQIESGQDLSMETFVYNMAIGRAASMFDQGGSRKESINMLTDFNEGSNQQNQPKMTTWEMLTNKDFIESTGDPLDKNWSAIVEDEADPDSFNREPMNVKAITINDPLMMSTINSMFVSREGGNYVSKPVEELGITDALAQNGQWINLEGVGATAQRATGRIANMPYFRTVNGKKTQQTEYTYVVDEKGVKHKRNVTIPYMEIVVDVQELKNWGRKQNLFDLPGKTKTLPDDIAYNPTMAGAALGMLDNDRQRGNPRLGKGKLKKTEGIPSGYSEAQMQMSTRGWFDKDGTIKVWIPLNSSVTGMHGEGLRTGTKENTSAFDRMIQAMLEQQRISQLATQN
jgi:hypothetical protein